MRDSFFRPLSLISTEFKHHNRRHCLNIFARETNWLVEPVTVDKLQSIVQIWEMTFTDYSLPHHAKKDFFAYH